MSLTRRIAWNTIIQVAGRIIYTILSLVIVIYLTRYLGLTGYGNYNIVIAFLGFFAVLGDFGLTTIMVREISAKKDTPENLIGNTLTLRIFLAVIVLAISIIVSRFFPYPPEVKTGILIFSLGIFFTLISQIFIGLFQIALRMDKATITELIGRAATLVITLWFIKLHYGLAAIILSAVIGNFLNVAFNYFLIRTHFKISLKYNPVIIKKIFHEALPVAVIVVLGVIFFKIDSVFLSVLPLKNVIFKAAAGLNNSEAVGVYGVPYRMLDVLITLPAIFVGLVYPVLSRHFAQHHNKGKISFQKAFDFLAIASFLFTLVLFVLSPQIISLIGGQEFFRSIPVLRLLSLALCLIFFTQIFGYTLIATGNQKKLIVPNLILVAINIGANLILIPKFSYLGAAIVTVLTQLVMVCFGLWLMAKFLKFIPSFWVSLKSLFAGVLIGIILWRIIELPWLMNINNFVHLRLLWQAGLILLACLISGILYLFILYVLGAISKESIKEIFSFGRKPTYIS